MALRAGTCPSRVHQAHLLGDTNAKEPERTRTSTLPVLGSLLIDEVLLLRRQVDLGGAEEALGGAAENRRATFADILEEIDARRDVVDIEEDRVFPESTLETFL